MIVLSVDGMPGSYLQPGSPYLEIMPNLRRLLSKSYLNHGLKTVNPSYTYPAHTSMISGVDPAVHGIYRNKALVSAIDNSDSWMWYDADIKVRTIFDFAADNGLKTASVYWPVTVGANIRWNIPQYWSHKNSEDEKLISSLSTPGLYNYLRRKTGVGVSELTGDKEKIQYALEIWKSKRPDLLLIYTTDLDAAHHNFGLGSDQARQVLTKLDILLGKLFQELNLFQRNDLGFILVSDHGFKATTGFCYMNHWLQQRDLLFSGDTPDRFFFYGFGSRAALVSNHKTGKLNLTWVPEFISFIETTCPNTKFVFQPDLVSHFRHEVFPQAIAYLENNHGGLFDNKLNSREIHYYQEKPDFYSHGFPKEDATMDTVGIFYPARVSIQFNSVRDVFSIACQWLKLKCLAGSPRK